MQSEGYVTKVELARHLRVSVRTVDNLMARNDIPYLVLGRLVRFKISEVDHALEQKYRINSAWEWVGILVPYRLPEALLNSPQPSTVPP